MCYSKSCLHVLTKQTVAMVTGLIKGSGVGEGGGIEEEQREIK